MKINLLDHTAAELNNLISEQGLPSYRAGQVWSWLYKGTSSFEEMTNLPPAVREKLGEIATTGYLKIVRKLQSAKDETCKFLFGLEDGHVIESVLMKYKYGYSVCISSQAGCRMGCSFCASAKIPFGRNLTPGEMLGQIITINKEMNIKIGHIVLMGIGEPLDNYDNVIKFLHLAQAPEGLGISYRKISLSTCGLVPGILKLAKENIPVTLSVSLHSPYDEQRSEMMPVNKKYPLDELKNACHTYYLMTGRRITYEYSMISGVNDTPEHGKKLSGFLKGMQGHVNLIPVNTVSGTGYIRSKKENIQKFQNILEKNGISATVRRSLGADIEAACGQLRKAVMEE